MNPTDSELAFLMQLREKNPKDLVFFFFFNDLSQITCKWILVSSTSKVSSHRIRDLGFELRIHYKTNRRLSDDKNNHRKVNPIR